MNKEEMRKILPELSALEDEITKTTEEYNIALEAIGKEYDTQIDALTLAYNKKWEALKAGIKDIPA